MSDDERVERFWRAYAATLSSSEGEGADAYVAEQFGDSAEQADELGALIVSGRKTATCSAAWEWEAEGKAMPVVGLKSVVLDGRGAPLCVTETTEVGVVPFDEVGADFARAAGEDRKSVV